MQLVLVCVRHGEANHNVDAKADMTETVSVPYTEDGVLDTPLTPRGRTQVTQVGMMEIDTESNVITCHMLQVGERLAGQRFDMAVSSDLQRARDTALAILGGESH